jgi:hypothetical protein
MDREVVDKRWNRRKEKKEEEEKKKNDDINRQTRGNRSAGSRRPIMMPTPPRCGKAGSSDSPWII